MKAMGYQALGAQLGEMSEVQQTALLLAFKRKLPVAEAIDLIDTRFKADPRCGHCASKAVGKWASQNGLARYRCKDCGRTFNAPTGTPLAQPHRRDAELAYAQALVDGVWLRKAAARCDIALDTAFRWRHRLLASVKDARPKTVAGVVEVDETFIPKSAKDSKRLAWRAPRKRGTKARSGLSSDDYAPALIVRDRHVATLNHVLTDLESAIFKCILKQVWHPTRCSSATVALSMDGSPRRQASHTSHSM